MRRDRRRGVATIASPCVGGLGADWSAEYRKSLRRTAERRKQRRRDGEPEAVGEIVLYPMPSAPFIRHTPGRHDEVLNLLRGLRGM